MLPEMEARLRECVARGAALLDEKRPGWRNEVDPVVLNVQSPCLCVLGQLYTSYTNGTREVGLRRFVTSPALGEVINYEGTYDAAGECGFVPATDIYGATFHRLTLLWREEVYRKPQGVTDAN